MPSQSAASYVSTRQIGEASVSIISDGSGQSVIVKSLEVPEATWRQAVPEADAQGEIVVGYNLALIRVSGADVLVDLGFDEPSPTSRWRAPRHRRSPGLEAGLAALGVRSEQIDYVLITHAHGDHFAGAAVERLGGPAPRFPRARHMLGRADWDAEPRPDAEMAALHLGTLEQSGLLELIDGDHEVIPGLTMIHAPGESPGHSVVRLQSGGETFFYLGDLFHHPCEVAHLDWVSRGRNAAAMEQSRGRLIAEAVPANATLVFTHRPFPGWGRIVEAGGGSYRWVDG